MVQKQEKKLNKQFNDNLQSFKDEVALQQE